MNEYKIGITFLALLKTNIGDNLIQTKENSLDMAVKRALDDKNKNWPEFIKNNFRIVEDSTGTKCPFLNYIKYSGVDWAVLSYDEREVDIEFLVSDKYAKRILRQNLTTATILEPFVQKVLQYHSSEIEKIIEFNKTKGY